MLKKVLSFVNSKRSISMVVAMLMLLSLIPSFQVSASGNSRAVTDIDNDNNDTVSTAQTILNDYTVTGYIDHSGDVDYYVVEFPVDGYANFWLGNIPTGKDYIFAIYSTNLNVADRIVSGGISAQLLADYPIVAGQRYYVKVYSPGNQYSSSAYLFRTKLYLENYSYYTQNPINFDCDNLSKLYNNGYATSWYTRLVNAGCAACSYAMVLKNMDASTVFKGEDVRTASSTGTMTAQYMEADPYSVLWASNGQPDIAYNSATGKYAANTTSGQDPVLTNLYNISYGFGVGYKRWDFTSQGETYKKQMVAKLVSEYPQGVCLYFYKRVNNKDKTHMIVVTGTTYSVPSSFTLPSPTSSRSNDSKSLSNSMLNDARLEYDYCSEITSEDIAAYQLWVDNAMPTAFTDAASFEVYDPYNGVSDPIYPGEGVDLSECYAGSVYSWDNLISVRVLYD